MSRACRRHSNFIPRALNGRIIARHVTAEQLPVSATKPNLLRRSESVQALPVDCRPVTSSNDSSLSLASFAANFAAKTNNNRATHRIAQKSLLLRTYLRLNWHLVDVMQYCDEHLCLSVCLSVCPRAYLRSHTLLICRCSLVVGTSKFKSVSDRQDVGALMCSVFIYLDLDY